MNHLKMLVAVYLFVVGVAVGAFFVIDPFFTDVFNVRAVWQILNPMSAVALPMALIYLYFRKGGECGKDPDSPATRGYVEVNAAFYAVAALTVLFFHNWFSLLSLGEWSLNATNQQAWVLWAVVYVSMPLVLTLTGHRLFTEAMRDWRSTRPSPSAVGGCEGLQGPHSPEATSAPQS